MHGFVATLPEQVKYIVKVEAEDEDEAEAEEIANELWAHSDNPYLRFPILMCTELFV